MLVSQGKQLSDYTGRSPQDLKEGQSHALQSELIGAFCMHSKHKLTEDLIANSLFCTRVQISFDQSELCLMRILVLAQPKQLHAQPFCIRS